MIDTSKTTDTSHIRIMPHNDVAEQMLLGTLLCNNEYYNKISDILRPEYFYIPIHQKIYESIQKFIEKGMLASTVSLKNFFDQDTSLQDMKGGEYLNILAAFGSSIINVLDYSKLLFSLYIKRQLIEFGQEVVNTAYTEDLDNNGEEQLEEIENKLFKLSESNQSNKGEFVHLRNNLLASIEKIQSAFKHKDSVTGTASGFKDLDSLLGGFQNSDLIILAGRPSMGKTAIVVNMAYNATKFLQKKFQDEKQQKAKNVVSEKIIEPSIGIFSLEMSGEQLATRLISMISGISSSKLRSGHMNQEDFAKVVYANKDMQNMPIFIDDTPALSIAALRTRARRLKRKNNVSLIVVDYLQLLKGSSKYSESNRVLEVSEITQGLKTIAKELNIPIIALSQLSRAVELREDKRPLLSDLRESGSIEQDADIVMFIFREDYYLMRKRPKEGTVEHEKWQNEMDNVMNVTELIIAKQRNGPIGTVKIHFDSKTTKFTDHVEKEKYF